ncbi:MAG: DUF835 domain-containing protein [Methanomassiliicoccales archaeon]
MLAGNQYWSLISLFIAFLSLALGLFVIRTGNRNKAPLVFFITMLLMFIGGVVDFTFMNAPNHFIAVIMARLLLFILIMAGAAFFYLSTFLPYEKSSGWFHDSWWLLFTLVGVVATIAAFILEPEDVSRTSYGWGITRSAALATWSFSLVFLVLSANVMLALVSRTASDKKVRAQIAVVALAVSSPVIYGLLYAILEELKIDIPPILSPGFLISALLMAYAVLRYRLFIINVAISNASKATKSTTNEYGMVQVYLEKKGEKALAFFVSMLAKGSPGAIISRTHPDILKEKYKLEGVPIIWLAQQPGEGRLDPANLSILQHSISQVFKNHPGAIVLLEGVEYLIANNTFDNVLKMLFAIEDEVVIHGGLLILTIDPEVLTQRNLAIFLRDFHVMEPE